MKLTKKLLYTLMAFACFSVFTLTSCSEEKTETTTETTEAAPAEAAPAPAPAATPADTNAAKMDTAAVKPVEAPVKK